MGLQRLSHDWETELNNWLHFYNNNFHLNLKACTLFNWKHWAIATKVRNKLRRPTILWLLNILLDFVVVVQSLSCVWLFATPWTAAHQASLSFSISWSLLSFMSIELVMLYNHLILCCSLSLCFQSFQHLSLFQWVDTSYQGAKVWDLQFQHQSFQWIVRTDFL